MTRAWLLLVGSLSVACSGGTAPSRDSPAPAAPAREAPAREAREGIYLVDVSRAAGLDIVQVTGVPANDYIIDSLGSGAAWLDYDGDGDPDLYLAQGSTGPQPGPPDRLLRNDGDADGDGVPSFTDVTGQAGLGDVLWSFGVAVADYDDDGDPDFYLTNWGANRLYRNDGNGKFTDVAGAAGVADPRWGVSAAWSDVDRDGDLDLYVTNYVEFDFERYPRRGEPWRAGVPPCLFKNLEVYCGPRNLEPGMDIFFRNDGDADGDGVPTFTESTVEAGLQSGAAGYGLGVLFVDTTNDGQDDLYVANDSVVNNYFVNRGDGTFRETGVLSGLAYNEQGHAQAGMGIASLDFNGDGLLDLVVTNFSHDHDTVYRNDGNATFTDVSFPAGLGGVTFFTLGWGVAPADLDHDGWEDLLVAHGHVYPQVDGRGVGSTFHQANGVFRHLGDERFEEVTTEAGPGLALIKSSRSVLPVDIDGDGDLDFLITNCNDTPDLLRNDGGAGNWLQVRLEGARGNRDGIGARITVQTGERRQIRSMTRTASYAASTLPVAHFGLGAAAKVDRLEVHWPSGKTTVQQNVDANRLLRIRE